jgi:hypothetical protein
MLFIEKSILKEMFMQSEVIKKLQASFDALAQSIPGEEIEFWFARDLQEPLGYARWENFLTAIQRAVESCKTTGYNPSDHFRGVTKMVSIGSGAVRPTEDFMVIQDDLQGEGEIGGEHVENNLSVREMLGARGIKPEHLLPEEDVMKLERRVKSEAKNLVEHSGKLPKLAQ